MVTRKTPIEHLAEGSSTDRQRRYEERKRAAGFTRVTEWVPLSRIPELKAMVREWAEAKGWQGSRDD